MKVKKKWGDKKTGRAPDVWRRGMDGYAMDLVDALDEVSEPSKNKQLLEILKRTADAIISVQDKKTGRCGIRF